MPNCVRPELERFASGTAKFELRADRIKFSAEVEDLAVTNEIFVFVQGILVGLRPSILSASPTSISIPAWVIWYR